MPESVESYSIPKGQTKAVSAATGIFGTLFFANWLAQILMPLAADWPTLIPGELLSQGGMAAFIIYVYALIKDALIRVGYWPRILV